MRVTTYKVVLTDNYHNSLLKERSINYGKIAKLQNPVDIYTLMNDVFHLNQMAEEFMYILAMNAGNSLNGVFELSHGNATSTFAFPREVLIRCLLCGATSFIMVHNHPSGDTYPSKDDILATKEMTQAAELIGITFLDHIIIGQYSYYSFKQHTEE